jgi:hypothetical protein
MRTPILLVLPLALLACGPDATRVVVLDDNLGASP